MFCELVKDNLVEYSYDAEIAGLDYGLGSYGLGVDVDVSGYSDKMAVLLEKVLISMRDLEVKPDRFKIIKERVLRSYRNWNFQQPYRQVGDFTTWLNKERGFINEQYLAELIHLTADDVASFFPELLSQMHIEMLAHGNVNREDALAMTDLIERTLKPRTLPHAQWHIRRNLILPEGADFTYQRTLSDPVNVNHCIEYYVQVGPLVDRVRTAKLLLLAQMTDELGFDQLRTKEQLGYVVFTGAKKAATMGGYRVIIQSEKPTQFLEERINAFLAMFTDKLKDMPLEQFESHKKSLINKRLEKIKNLGQECGRFWLHISNEFFDFRQVDMDVAHIRPLTKDQMLEFFQYHIHPSSQTRAKLSIHMVAQSSPKAMAGSVPPEERTEKVLSLLRKALTSMGINVKAEQLQTHFKPVNVSGGDQKAMLEALASYLKDLKISEDQSKQIVEQVEQLLGTVLPSLGIEVQQATDEGAADLPVAPPVKTTTYIDNVHDYKASLAVSAGARPVTDLKEFEDIEPKL